MEIKSLYDKTTKNKLNNNLTQDQRAALTNLQNSEELTIKPADKGGGVVVYNTNHYDQNIRDLLNIEEHYKKARLTDLNTLKLEVSELLNKGREEGHISDNEYKFLLNNHPVIPAIYGLPKIHKRLDNPPMRPIISGIGSILEPLSQYVDFFLQPIVKKQRSYLKDTTHAITTFEGRGFNKATQFLVALDIEALYTNIPQNDTIQVIASILEQEDLKGGHHSNQQVTFLDIIIKEEEGILKVELYTKPTDKNTLLLYSSNHPKSQKDNVPFGEFLRLRRNCTNLNDFYKHAENTKLKLENRGYPKKLIKNALKRARFYDRDSLLDPERKSKKNPTLDRIVFVTQYSHLSNQIKNIVNKNWKILNQNREIQLDKPLFSFRRNKTIKNSLVHTYPIAKEKQLTLSGNLASGNFKCGTCSICPQCIVGSKLEHNGKNLKPTTFNNCRSQNVIYLLLCPCNLGYVGETGRELRIRVLEHKSAIRTSKINAPLTEHYKEKKHSCDDIRWFILEKVRQNRRGGDGDRLRKRREQWYLCYLNTIDKGLNTREDWAKCL
ncbi:uncharacterized protein LOC144773834 [Lissotriton helveticus]